MYGRAIYKILRDNNISIDGFVVTKNGNEVPSELEIYEAKDVLNSNAGVVLGINYLNGIKEVKDLLESIHFNMDDVVCEYEIPVDRDENFPIIDVTTKIACEVNCRFCPQSALVEAYFKHDSTRDRSMRLETFSKCVEKLPGDCLITFSGFSEPFLNPDCMEMIKIAFQSGRRVDLYTTLVGATGDMVDQICKLPFGSVVLHVADRYGHAHIPVSEQYYENVKKMVNAKKKDGTPLLDFCNAQAEPDERVVQICSGKMDIRTVMIDRAGNLSDDSLFRKEYPTGPIQCRSLRKPQYHVLLPDGTMVLCCMDFGMKHVLGNLLVDSYENIVNGLEMQKVEKGLADDRIDILCRKCCLAHPVGDIGQNAAK